MDLSYEDFIRRKMPVAEAFGFEPPSEPHASLKPHQRDIAAWMVRGGRRACFASFGLGKTRIHLQVAIWCVERTARKYLIVAPLGVRQEFTRNDGPAMGLDIVYCRTDAEVAAASTPYIITNYERVRDGDITLDPQVFGGAGLDESSILRSYGSQTFQTFRKIFKAIPYRFVFTATPSPNRHKELIHYSDFLGVLDSGDALTRFFKRDSQKAGNLTLFPSQEEKFWLWLSSWAVFMQSPADLGYDATGYDLPSLLIHWHRLPTDHTKAWKQFDSWGQAQLICDQSSGLKELAETKRESMFTRLEFARQIIEKESHKHWLLWHHLEDERRLIEKLIPNVRTVYGSQDLEEREQTIVDFSHGLFPILAGKPSVCGSGCNFQCHCADAIFMGADYKLNDFLQAIHRIYRYQQTQDVNVHIIYTENEEPVIEALKLKWALHTKLVTKMTELLKAFKLNLKDMKLIRSVGCNRAEVAGKTFRAILNDCILELSQSTIKHEIGSANPLAQGEQKRQEHLRQALSSRPSGREEEIQQRVVSEKQNEVHCENGGLLQEEPKEEKGIREEVCRKAQGKTPTESEILLLSKPRKVSSDIEMVRNQTEIRSNEGAVLSNAEEARQAMSNLQCKVSDASISVGGSLPQDGQNTGTSVSPLQRGIGAFSGRSINAEECDSVSEKGWPDNCVDQIVTSIPFGTLYEYSPSFNDLGHNESNTAFFEQMDYLIPHLLRVLRSGRIACIHVKDRIRFGNVTGKGMPTVDRFSDKTADRFEHHGFEFMGRITVDTDVVRENNQTYRLGWSENAKDSTKMGVGMPEYVLLFRKLPSDTSNAYADVPVSKDKSVYMRSDWQIDASELYRSNGNRLPDVKQLLDLPLDAVGRIWKEHSKTSIYNHAEHVALCKEFEAAGRLPAAFMLFPPISRHPDIWTDIARMRVLNSEQGKRNQENHVCPLQTDIVERLIGRYSNPGEIILDPFAGIFTVPYIAIKMGRIGWGIELSEAYWKCGVGYCEQMEAQSSMPTLFDLNEMNATHEPKAEEVA